MNDNSLVNNKFGRKGWYIIVFTMIIYLISSCAADTLNVSVGAFAQTFGWNSNAMLSVSGIGGFVGIVVSLIFGQIIAKKGVKVPLMVLLGIYAVLWGLYGSLTSMAGYAVIVILVTAVSTTINLVPTQQLMANWFPRKKGIALGWATMGMTISGALMIPVFQKMFSISIGAPFYLMVGICVVLIIVTVFTVKGYPEEAGAFPDNIPVSKEEAEKSMLILSEHKSTLTVKKLLTNKNFWLITLIFGFLFFGLVGTFAQLIPRMCVVGINQNTAIMWCTVACLIGIVGSYIWGLIDQKIGTKPTVIIFAALWTLMNVFASVGAFGASISLTMVSVVMLALFIGGLGNLMPSMAIQVFGRFDFPQANKVMVPIIIGIRSCSLLVASAVLEGFGTNVLGGYGTVFIIFGVLSLIATIMAIFVGDRKKKA